MIHPVHGRVEHGKEKKEEVGAQQGWKVEGHVDRVGQREREPLALLKVGNVAEHDNALAHERGREHRDPRSVPEPGEQAKI